MTDNNAKPLLITVSGYSGSGKSTLAKALAEALPNAVYIDSDRTRKELFGIPATERLPQEAYAPEFTKKLVEETNRRIKEAIDAGKTVVQSVVLLSPSTRERQKQLAADVGAQFQGIWLQADVKTLFDRVAARKGDASDAGVDHVEKQVQRQPGDIDWPILDANQPREDVLRAALALLPAQPAAKATPKPAAPGL